MLQMYNFLTDDKDNKLVFVWFSLQPYPVKEGLTGAQTIDLLVKRVQTLGGQLSGQFLVDCDTFGSMMHMGKILDKCY